MYLLFDVGGTNMRVATSSDGNSITNTEVIPTPKDFQQALITIKKVSDQLSGGQKIKAAVMGLAGPLDKDKTMLVASPHIGGWIQKPLKKEIESIFNVPTYLEHEADLQGLGEVTMGKGQGYKIVASITIGTGVAATRIVEGKIDSNALGFEVGHHIIMVDGSPCDCGGKGHLESYVSGSGLARRYGKKANEISDPQVWDEVARYLAIGLNNVTVFWSPDIIVLGGPVMESIPLERVRSYFKEFLTIFPQPPLVEKSQLGDKIGLYGALAYIRGLNTH